MAARPRKYKQHVANLYQKTDKRNGKTYFTYKHPLTGKMIGLGCDRDKAFEAARQANILIAEQKLEQLNFAIHQNPKAVKIVGLSAKSWVARYQKIQQERAKSGELTESTLKNKNYLAQMFSDRFGNRGIKDISTKDIVDVIDAYKSEGKAAMASNIKSLWIDLYKEAQYAGEVEPGFNPAIHTRNIKLTPQRQRVSESELVELMDTDLFKSRHYLRMAVKLAITTGLRRADIADLKFSDVKGNHLFVSLKKSVGKTKLAFPLTLTNPFLGQSLGEIIKECRSSRIVSKYMVHSSENAGRAKRGDQISLSTLSKSFMAAKRECSKSVAESSFSFHELRSFAERTYREAGYDTKVILGHKHQAMTDKYNDDRADNYTYIVAPKAAN
ncbi:phage integrase Arm DNA-binding domain-containing protein [Vibrio fluvialis]|nr:phage integrase Arm DNA-binding domain-containing protein [Vibrio fluvialis]EKO3527607.1 phage integrase Arm DNA-binding domain-containing protein [Vibrio fluvialis]ELP3312413.1 phage integrase Arm DNA-binding domain-containing protein [Vibrio fluvialis]